MHENLPAQVIGYVEKSGQALGDAKILADITAAEHTKIAALAPAVTAEIQRGGLLEQHDAANFTTKISSHEGALGVIRKLASLLGEARVKLARFEAVSPGVAVDAPSAAKTANERGCFVGSHIGLGQHDMAKHASEVALGLASPVE